MIRLLYETARAVWEAFRSNRMRFVLTLSGVVIGSASLVLLSGLLAGGREALMMASRSAEEQDLVEVKSRGVPYKDRHHTTRTLGRDDVETLDASPLLSEARVVGQRVQQQQIYWKGKKQYVSLMGARWDALDLYHLALARGRYFNDGDLGERRRVAVVGHKIWSELFDEAQDLGKLEINTGGQRFTVIGVLAHKPAFGGDGPWQWDSRVLMPDTTFAVVLPPPQGDPRAVERLFVRLADVRYLAERLPVVSSVVRSTLLRRHYGVENFRVKGEDRDGKDELILGIISVLIMGTAVISLVVGGINVMNIMLVSVTERTREIGIRRAVGASRGVVLLHFLAESMLTAGLGGLLGVGGGVGATWLAARILDKVTGGWVFHLVAWAPPLALGAALLVGGVFGLYPAWRAAHLDPVEALRFE
jgi:putative ABC transport system permease protein